MATSIGAQQAEDSVTPTATPPMETPTPEPPELAAPDATLDATGVPQAPAITTTVATGEPTLYRLQGGGELVGTLIKRTPYSFFIDIGPTIVDVPAQSVLQQTPVSQLKEESEDLEGLEPSVLASATNAASGSRTGGGRILSQQEIIENVKRSVVLVSNPGGLGTGWLISDDGLLVTNHHVVGNETYQTVTIFVKSGDQWERKRIENNKVEAYSSLLDIAIVRLDMDKVRELGVTLDPLEIAEPNSLQPGDVVYAVGNPGMGYIVLEHTISEGIVSSLARNFNDVLYLQTTAAVNPGNSGGPLINQRGQVVGLITLKSTFQEGVAFALPVDYIRHFIRHSRAFAVNETARNKGFRYHRPQ